MRHGVLILLLLSATIAAAKDEPPPRTFRVGGTQRDMAMHAATGPAGELYVVGAYTGRSDFDPATAAKTAQRARLDKPSDLRRMNAFLARYEPDGRFAWVRGLGASGTNIARCVTVSDEGVVCVTGHFSGTMDFDPQDPPDEEDTYRTGQGRDAFITCYTPDGEFLWARCFGDEDIAPKGSKELAVEWSEGIRGAVFDGDENLYAVGMYRGTIDLDPGPGTREVTSQEGSRDIFVVSLDKRGAFRWGRSYGGRGSDQGHAIALAPKDGLLVGGCFSEMVHFDPKRSAGSQLSAGGMDAFVLWLDRSGGYRRVVTWGGPQDDQVLGGGLAADKKGVVYAAGDFSATVDFDPGPKKDKRKTEGARDAFVLRVEEDGTYGWAATFGGDRLDAANDLCLTSSGHVVVAGRFHGDMDVDPGRRKRILRSSGTGGATDAFVVAYDAKGKVRWAHALGPKISGPGKMTRAQGVASFTGGDVVVVGNFYRSFDADPSRKQVLLQSLGDMDVFVVRYDAKGKLVR